MSRFHSGLVLVVLLTIALLATGNSYAQTMWYVDDDAPNDPGPDDPAVSDPLEDGSPEHPFDAIQEGIDAAADGNEVLLADGIYTGEGNTELDPLGKPITVRGMSGIAEDCVIDGGHYDSGFYLHSGETPATVIADLTIQNSDSAIVCFGSGVTVDGCRLVDNRVGDHSSGAAVYAVDSDLVLIDCLISGNCAGGCAGISVNGGSLILERCTIRENRGLTWVGAVCVETWAGDVSGKGTHVITDCRIEENVGYSAGGIRAHENVLIQNCLIRRNHTFDYTGAISGGQYVNCLIADNIGHRYAGGAGYADRLVNCTVVDNTAEEGPALEAGQVANCIVWGNAPEQIETGTDVTYSCVDGGWPGTGNIDDNPQLAFDEDFHLTAGSPCIGAGTNDPPGGLLAVDFEGNPRPLPAGGVADMGAYEFNTTQPTIAVSSRELRRACLLGSGDPAWMTLSIRNAGGGNLDWELVPECPWLTCDPPSGTSAGEVDDIMLKVNVSGLPHGKYVSDLMVTAPGAVNGPVHITFTLSLTDTLDVPADHATIQAAIDEAIDGDRIVIADGVYTGEGNVALDLLGKEVAIESASGDPSACVIDCAGASYGLRFSPFQGDSTVLSGIQIRNAGYSGVWVGVDASPSITNCRFEDGAGVGLYIGHRSNPRVSHCVFAGNSGSGVAVWNQADPTFSRCTFLDNQDSGVYHYDYCICYGGSNVLRFDNCLFAGNTGVRGGGLGIESGVWAELEVRNCTFYGNFATDSGGGLKASSPTSLHNTILWGNDAPEGSQLRMAGGDLDLAYCDVQGGLGGCSLGEYVDLTLTELIDANPLCADPAGGDYHLSAGSPCIDAGDPDFVPQPDETDMDAEPRIMGCRVDMGADESPAGELHSGDMDASGTVDLPDVPLFVSALLDQGTEVDECVADTNGDGAADGRDIQPFVNALLEL